MESPPDGRVSASFDDEGLEWEAEEGASGSFSSSASAPASAAASEFLSSSLASSSAPYSSLPDSASSSSFAASFSASFSAEPELFPWGELAQACAGCEAHLAVLEALRRRFPAAVCVSTALSASVEGASAFLLNFAALHSLTLFAVGAHPKQGGREARRRNWRDELEPLREAGGGGKFGIEGLLTDRDGRTRAHGSRDRPAEVLYSWTAPEEAAESLGGEEPGERRQGRRSLPRFFALSVPLPPAEILMEAALLARRREERKNREEAAKKQLLQWREKKIFVHSAMTDVHDFSYDTTKQRFQTTPLKPLTLASLARLFCDSSVFASMYNRRYYVLQQRCLLHPLLTLHGREGPRSGRSLPAFALGGDEKRQEDESLKRVISEVDGATRRSGQRQLLIGVLGRDANKELALQGLFSDIRIKFEKGFVPRPGFFLEGHVVLADGCFRKDDDFFHILDLSHPPRCPASDRLVLGRRAAAAAAARAGAKRRRWNGSGLSLGESWEGVPFFEDAEDEDDGLIARQQASSMFGGLLGLNELEALEAWRCVEEEREDDREDGEDLREFLPLLVPALQANASGEKQPSAEKKRSSKNERKEFVLDVDPDAPDPMAWVIISECHFNDPRDLQLLDAMLSTFESEGEYPSGFVFLGNFSASFSGGEDAYSAGFNALFELLTSRYPSFVARCHFVFVPGPDDPSFARESLPRLPLTPPFTADFQQRLERVVPACKGKIFFTTSPCRIRHFTSSMVFFRHDVFKALSRDALFSGGRKKDTEEPTSVDTDIVDILYNTIVGQAHLCPMTADHRLTKHRDQSLGLFPMPDLVFLCDKSAPPVNKKDPKFPDEFIFANAGASFRETKAFFIYEMVTHQLTKYLVPSK
ncbi:DNA polymerase epsilon subunit B protein [Besnoitia besnoiti]|uniref:DNA polymerase II subunit 2 n=1 Tax=Besnoitia besnoiti TaxID=94643 RepID=A0A2A9MKV9_BESBE|nr:DNA polymerase epsilon subunit B protein [Besnoitia besnoiti]PFH36070.1 DNA polymerase epsilon subunit B protein [Besnoitia besnoiti]